MPSNNDHLIQIAVLKKRLAAEDKAKKDTEAQLKETKESGEAQLTKIEKKRGEWREKREE